MTALGLERKLVGGRDGRVNCLTAAWSRAAPKFRLFKDAGK